MTAPLLEFRQVAVDVDGRRLLAVETLAIDQRETLAVLGANGAGKSTLLRVAGALRAPSAGHLLLDGRPAEAAALRRISAAVLQRPILRRGSVRMNAATGLRLRGVGRRQADLAVTPWLARLGIADLAGRAVGSLSGGEAQRVSLVRALALEPRLLLLDEPFGSLDAPSRGELLTDLRHLLRGIGTTVILVTHDLLEARALGDRIAVLDDGRIRQLGDAAAVVDAPADAACARLLGYENILPAALDPRLPAERVIALRARDLAVAATPATDSDRVTLQARLNRVVPLGALTRLQGVLADGTPVTADLTPECGQQYLDLERGAPVCFDFDRRDARPLPHIAWTQ